MRRDFWERAEERRSEWRRAEGVATPEEGGEPWTDTEIINSECQETEATYADRED